MTVITTALEVSSAKTVVEHLEKLMELQKKERDPLLHSHIRQMMREWGVKSQTSNQSAA